eukprot:8559537-Pyramimonas_sp.AAC.1
MALRLGALPALGLLLLLAHQVAGTGILDENTRGGRCLIACGARVHPGPELKMFQAGKDIQSERYDEPTGSSARSFVQ